MYFVYGCPKVLSLRPEPKPGEEILAVSFNPSGSLLAIASTSRLCLWSGGKDHVPLGVLPLSLRGLPGTSLLWKRDSSLVAGVSSAGKLVLVSVKRKAGARPASERFAVPDWFEPQHARTVTGHDGQERDPWADPAEAELAVVSTVESIGSEASAMCLGRFGQHVLLGTANGSVYGVSWAGQIICCYDIVAGPSLSPRGTGDNGGDPLERGGAEAERLRFGGAGASSMSFNDTLQLLALTTTDGNFFLGTLSKTTCWLRNIAVTDGSKRPTPASSRRNPDRAPPPASSATANNESSNIDGSQASPARGWGWRLLGTGRSAVAAAANAAVDALSAPLPTDDETDNSEDPHFVGRGRGGGGTAGERSGAGEGRGDGAAAAAATGAVGVEFSVKGCLMAVALEDGTVLLTRVERYTSGVRARHKLQISNSMLHRSDSHRLEAYLADETRRVEQKAGGDADGKGDAPSSQSLPRIRTFSREETMSSLWGVEVHHLNCLSLDPWLGPGDGNVGGTTLGPAGRVLSLCFSADGWALAVGHEGALTVWSTEDGTRLVCTTSDTHEDNAHPEETPSPTTRAPAIGRAASTDGGGGSAESEPLSPSSRRPAAGTLDVIAGGARALSWESEGYRLLSVGSAVGGGEGTTGQGIVAFDFLRRARSNLSSSLLSLQGSDRIALVDSQPWSAQVLLWRVLPVHPGYLSSNAPLRHVSTSRAGTYVAVAGSKGLAVYSRPTNRWRLFGNIEQEREVEVAGMCWWGESALVVASRLKHGFILLLYSRKHLSSEALMLPPIRLPVGMRPLFMQAVQEVGSKPGTDVLFLLVAGSTSYLLYRFSCTGDVLESGKVTYSVLHEGPLPHVLVNMDPPLDPDTSDLSLPEPPPRQENPSGAEENASPVATPGGTLQASAAAAAAAAAANGAPGTGVTDGDSARNNRVATTAGVVGSRVAVVNGGRGGSKEAGKREGSGSGSLPDIGPPKRVVLLPEVHPRSIALLDFDGNLVTMEMGSGEVKRVAEGVDSIVDLSGVSEAWEVWEMPLLVHPCYLLRRKGKAAGIGGGENGGEEASEEYSVWCPAMRLDPCPPSVQRLLTPGRASGIVGGAGDKMTPSPVFSLDPGASCDPERVDLGLQPLLGTMVHASQVVCRPRVSNTPPLPPCYEVRTHLRPILHMVLRHLLIASQLQLLASPPPPPPRRRATTTTGPAPLPSPRARTPHPFVVAPVAQWQEEDGGLRGRDSGGLPVAASLSAGAAATGEALGGSGEGHDRDNWNGGRSAGRSNLPKSAEAAAIGEGRGGGGTGSLEEGDSDTDGGDRQERDWHGTSSDAFEIAVAVLKRCREDSVLVEALPDTLELLLRACMEGLNVAGERAKRDSYAAPPRGGAPSGSSGARQAATAAVSELELARAVMSDSVYLAQLAPECFHEVVARVARKAEPERYALLFPLHLVAGGDPPAGDQKEAAAATAAADRAAAVAAEVSGSTAAPEEGVMSERAGAGRMGGRVGGGGGGGVGPGWGRWVHPTHLFHECVSSGKLTTAAWYLPLIRDDVAYDAAQSHVGPDGPLSEEERSRVMPLEMWAVTGQGWSFGLSHALSCVLLLASLSSNQHTFLPEVWLFARKREQSAPHHHHHHHHHHHSSSSSNSAAGAVSRAAEDHGGGGGGVPDTPWWSRGQGAAIEALLEQEESRAKAAAAETATGRTGGDSSRFRSGSVSGLGWGGGGSGGVWGGSGSGRGGQRRRIPGSPVTEASLKGGEGTHFGRTSGLRLRALRRPGRLGDAGAEDGVGFGDRAPPHRAEASDGVPPERQQSSTLSQRSESERARLYHLPFTRDAASVVSRFMWKELNDLRVKVVLRAFQSLASSAAAREAGLDAGQVLGALSPARRSMAGTLHSSPVETMAGLLVVLAEMFKVSVGTLALLAAPAEQQQEPPSSDDSSSHPAADTPAAAATAAVARPQGTPSPSARGSQPSPASSSTTSGAAPKSASGSGNGGGVDGSTTTAAQRRALLALSASVQPQLGLLLDLSQAVGHTEAVFVCASLLRDTAATTATLRHASQTVRVGYGRFISDLLQQVKIARTTAVPQTAADSSSASETNASREILPPKGSHGLGNDGGRGVGSGSGPTPVGTGTAGGAAGAMALIGLQRFGGKCIRALADGVVLA